MGNRTVSVASNRTESRFNTTIGFEGNCARCGAPYLRIQHCDRWVNLPTCSCKEETLNHLLNVIIKVLDETINEPKIERAKSELSDFIEEFGDWKD